MTDLSFLDQQSPPTSGSSPSAGSRPSARGQPRSTSSTPCRWAGSRRSWCCAWSESTLPSRAPRQDLPGAARPAPGGRRLGPRGDRQPSPRVDGLRRAGGPGRGRELLHRMRFELPFQAGQDGLFIFRWAPAAEPSLGEPSTCARSASSSPTPRSSRRRADHEGVPARVEPGVNPELELLRFLTAHGFPHIASLAGWYEVEGRLDRRHAGDPAGVPARLPRRLRSWRWTSSASDPTALLDQAGGPRRGHR